MQNEFTFSNNKNKVKSSTFYSLCAFFWVQPFTTSETARSVTAFCLPQRQANAHLRTASLYFSRFPLFSPFLPPLDETVMMYCEIGVHTWKHMLGRALNVSV